jgi:hypothetical protein
MIQSVYLVVVPGADRVFVTGHYPESFVKTHPKSKVFRADVALPGIDKVDGKLELTAEEIAIATPKTCACHLEAGDSPCPVHGDSDE